MIIETIFLKKDLKTHLLVITKVYCNGKQVCLHPLAHIDHYLTHSGETNPKLMGILSVASNIGRPPNSKHHMFAWGYGFPKNHPLLLYVRCQKFNNLKKVFASHPENLVPPFIIPCSKDKILPSNHDSLEKCTSTFNTQHQSQNGNRDTACIGLTTSSCLCKSEKNVGATNGSGEPSYT